MLQRSMGSHVSKIGGPVPFFDGIRSSKGQTYFQASPTSIARILSSRALVGLLHFP